VLKDMPTEEKLGRPEGVAKGEHFLSGLLECFKKCTYHQLSF